MSGLQSVSVLLCYTCVGVSILTVLIPQKRTRRIMSFVIGLFFISTLVTAVAGQMEEADVSLSETLTVELPTYSEKAYLDTVAQMTADNLTKALDELLQSEGIKADDIRLTLKTSGKGSITVVRAVIYISEANRGRINEIESIVYRNIAKEPEIHVTGEETQRVAE